MVGDIMEQSLEKLELSQMQLDL